MVEALEARGFEVVDTGPAEAVVVGWHRTFNFDRLDRASAAIRAGARFVATNIDATYPAPDGLLPGNGSLVAAVATAAGRRPEVAGKPEPPTVALVRARFGDRGVIAGDRPSTDGALAAALGWPFALVVSAATRDGDEPADHDAAFVGPSLAALADEMIEASALVSSDGRRSPSRAAAAAGPATRARARPRRNRPIDRPEDEAADVGGDGHAGVGVGEELQDEPPDQHDEGRQVDELQEDEQRDDGQDPGLRIDHQVGAHDPGDGARRADHRDGRVRLGGDVGQRRPRPRPPGRRRRSRPGRAGPRCCCRRPTGTACCRSRWSHEPWRNIDTTTARKTFLSGNGSAESSQPPGASDDVLALALLGQVVGDRLGVGHLAGDGRVLVEELDLLGADWRGCTKAKM